MHKRMGKIRKVFEPTAQLKGRVGAVWVQSATHSVCAFSLYFRPDPTSKISRTVAIQINDWVDGVLSQLPCRCTPIITMDLNDDGDSASLPAGFGPCHGRPPKHNASTLAATVVNHHMTIASSHRPHGPTFFGATWNSRIDHIALPCAALPRMRTAFVDHRAGDTLQLVVPKHRTNASLARRGHRQLTLLVELTLS